MGDRHLYDYISGPSEDSTFLVESIDPYNLMPNLERITFGQENMNISQYFDYTLLYLFTSPALLEFDVLEFNQFTDPDQFEMFLNLLNQRLLTVCSKLQKLRLFSPCQERDDEMTQDDIDQMFRYKDLPIPSHLTTISFSSDMLNLEFLAWISKMPALRDINIWDFGAFSSPLLEEADFHEDSFQNVRVLTMDSCDIQGASSIWNTLLVRRLTEAKCVFMPETEDESDEDDSDDDNEELGLEHFIELVLRQTRHLNKLDLTAQADHKLLFCPSEIQVTSWHDLEVFSMSRMDLYGLHPLRSIASIWPGLRKLELLDFQPTFQDFVQLPTHLPNLDCLSTMVPKELQREAQLKAIFMNDIPIGSATLRPVFHTNLHLLHLQPDNDVVALLSRFFSRWSPKMQCIPADQRDFMDNYAALNDQILALSSE
ncbi:hypothetical protein RhiJN_24652 [Ceratobasidium sp. AG-Ba]|nr:hypothetical protein RhiJN_24652 [Ceratobasidium sp. AG-Ba]